MSKPDTPFPKHWRYYIVLKWAVILAAVVLLCKLAPAPSVRRTWLLSGALVAMAIVYRSMA